jgi:SAM-dependent methyltransferase
MSHPNPFATIQQISSDYIVSRCLHCAAELGVADVVGDGSKSISDVAKTVGANADALRRIVRLLASRGVFALKGDVVSQTPASSLLRADNPTSMRDYARMLGLPLIWRSTEMLMHAVRTGEAAAPLAFDGGFWGRFAEHPEEARVFDAAMVGKATAQIPAVLAAYDFTTLGDVVDVGGGNGHLIRAILQQSPKALGILFDLPHVVEAARKGGDVGGRLRFQGGDFFKDDLPKAGAYVMMEVIHDWADEPAREIIAAVRKSARPGAKLLLIETEVPDGTEPDWSKTLDILMLSLFAARQRTAEEYRALLKPGGFDLRRVVDSGAGITVFEAAAV